MPDGVCIWLAQLHEVAAAHVSHSGCGSPATRRRDRSRLIGRGATDWYHPWDSGSGGRLHGTILHFMGFDYEKLTYRLGGYNYRLTDGHGNVAKEILA